MIKHNFKIGDKVELKNPGTFSLGIDVLTIVRIEKQFIKVIWGGVKKREFPLYPCEIKHVVKIGQQLLFSFMGDN